MPQEQNERDEDHARPQKTYRLLTKDRKIAEVPRQGNRIVAARQGAGYAVGYTAGAISAIIVEPLVGMVRNTHEWRGVERGWTEAHRKVDTVHTRIATIRSTEVEELAEMCVEKQYCTADEAKRMSHGQLARLWAEKETPKCWLEESDLDVLNSEFSFPDYDESLEENETPYRTGRDSTNRRLASAAI